MSAKVLQRKVRIVQKSPIEGGTAAERAWRVAFGRALRDCAGVPAEFTSLTISRMSLAEVLDLPPERALILTLEGPEDGLGLLMFAPEVMSGIVEMMTLGRHTSLPVEIRKPTRTDAAMLAPVAEVAMRNFAAGMEAEIDLAWADDFHYASCLEDARPLALLLEDIPYKVLRGQLSLADGARGGQILLVLPAEGKGRRPAKALPDPEEAKARIFAEHLAAQVERAEVRLEAVVGRLTLPIGEAMALQEGMVLPLPQATLETISLEGLDARSLCLCKLGQHRGARALRICSVGQTSTAQTPVLPEPLEDPVAALALPFATDLQSDLYATGTE